MLRVARRYVCSVYKSGHEALADAKDGTSYMIPGFGIVGIPENSLRTLHEKRIKDLTLYTNSVGLNTFGHGPLITSGQVKRVYVSFLGFSHVLEKMFLGGEAEVIPTPQGTLVEKMRSARAGIGGFYTRTSVGTLLEEGKFPIKVDRNGTPERFSPKKETEEFDRKTYVLEEAFKADYCLVKAFVGDRAGNLRFRKTARNFNPDIAGGAKVTVAEVEHLVDRLEPDKIHMPGVFVNRLYQGEWYGKKIETIRLRELEESVAPQTEADRRVQKIARRVALEYQDGMYINLGVGLPGETPRYCPPGVVVTFQVENGIVGGGDFPTLSQIDSDLTNAAKVGISETRGVAYVGSAESFGMMRGYHLHMTVLGGMQVSEKGDLANYFIPGKMYRGVGGAMDLVAGCDKVVVAMEHGYAGAPRVLSQCTLPLTASRCVNKLVTEYAVFEFDKKRHVPMTLVELSSELTLEQLKALTPAKYIVSPTLRPYQTSH